MPERLWYLRRLNLFEGMNEEDVEAVSHAQRSRMATGQLHRLVTGACLAHAGALARSGQHRHERPPHRSARARPVCSEAEGHRWAEPLGTMEWLLARANQVKRHTPAGLRRAIGGLESLSAVHRAGAEELFPAV